jgi:hypothetical protein
LEVTALYFQPLAANPGLDRRNIAIVKPTLSTEVALRAAYAAALSRPWADAPLSRRNDKAYADVRANRRRDLEAIIRSGLSRENRERALDLICAICEESSWAENIEMPFDDAMHPVIDLFAAETACLLAWVCRCGALDARTQGRMLHEIRARLITPIMAHDDYPCLSGEGFAHLATVCDAMAAALLAETDNARLYTLLRRLSRTADRLTADYRPHPLREELTDWTAATSLWQLFRKISGPSAGMALPVPGWLDKLLISHVGGGDFIDPMGDGMCRGASGMDVYLLGRAAGDDAVCALGASLYRDKPSELSSINARMLADLTPGIVSETRPVPRLRHGAVPGGGIMMARGGGVMAEIHSSGRLSAGGMYISIENAPIIAPLPGSAPIINGLSQISGAADGDWEFDDDRAHMSCDLTRLYPAAAGVRFYQRTLMLDRREGLVRVIDVLETDRPGSIKYAFATPQKADLDMDGALLGVGRISWDRAMAHVNHRDDPAFRDGLDVIEIEYELLPGSNMLNFMIERS